MRMGWAGFPNDVFISYARVDNASVDTQPDKGWVAQFHRHLEIALSKRIGRLDTVRIWRDTRELNGNQLFDQTIREAIGDSAVFLALSSEGYFQSDYCRDELKWFFEKARSEQLGLAVGDQYRIFNALINNVPRSSWPQEYGRTTGFALHDALDATSDGEPTEFSNEVFRRQLRALADSIHGALSSIRNRAVAPRDPMPEDPRRRFRVYLADTSDTLASVRKRAINELRQRDEIELGASVPPPFDAEGHDQRVNDELQKADLSVHLLDAFPGREILDKDGESYPRRQASLALERGKPQLIWVPPNLSIESIEDDRHREFLTQLESGNGTGRTYDFQRELSSSITQQILAKVESLKSRVEPVNAVVPETTLLDTHVRDQIHALELGKYLITRQVLPYIVPQEDDPTRNENAFSDSLKRAAILIVIYGTVTIEWVRARLAHALQVAMMTDGSPLRACGVYMAPPCKPNDKRFTVPAVPVIWMDHTNGFDSASIDDLLSRARAAGARP